MNHLGLRMFMGGGDNLPSGKPRSRLSPIILYLKNTEAFDSSMTTLQPNAIYVLNKQA